MADFKIAYLQTVHHEGFYVSQEYWRKRGDTRSGETYMGIDRAANPKWAGWAIIDKWKAANGTPKYNFRFPASLGLEELVMAASKVRYWDNILGDKIVNQQIANFAFELIFMSGGWGIKQIQKSVNALIAPKKIDEDGDFGNTTLGYVNGLDAKALYSRMYEERKGWYLREKAKGNTNADGWLNRLRKFPPVLV